MITLCVLFYPSLLPPTSTTPCYRGIEAIVYTRTCVNFNGQRQRSTLSLSWCTKKVVGVGGAVVANINQQSCGYGIRWTCGRVNSALLTITRRGSTSNYTRTQSRGENVDAWIGEARVLTPIRCLL